MSRKDFDEWYSMWSAFVWPVCMIGAVLGTGGGQETWWAGLCVIGLVVWFYVVPFFFRDL